jgi:hypothetical protein
MTCLAATPVDDHSYGGDSEQQYGEWTQRSTQIMEIGERVPALTLWAEEDGLLGAPIFHSSTSSVDRSKRLSPSTVVCRDPST